MRATCVLLLTITAACGHTLPSYRVHVPPRLADVRVPPSLLFATGQVPLEGLARALEEAVPPSLTGERRMGPFALRWSLARQPARLRADGDALALEVAERGELEVRVGPITCRQERGGFDLIARARPALDEGGALSLADAAVGLQPPPPLDCAGLRVPVAVLYEALSAGVSTGLRAVLARARLPLGAVIDPLLDVAAAPRSLTVEGRAMCLQLSPSALVLTPLAAPNAKEGALTLAVGAEVAPRLSTGSCPAAPAASRPRDPVRVRAPGAEDTFSVDVALALDHATLEAELARALVGRRFGGARHVIVRGVTVGDAEGRLLVRLEVRGAVDGALYLWGTPRIERREGRVVLDVPDLQTAAETQSIVQRIGLWLWELTSGGLTAEARRLCRIDLTDRVEAARASLSRSFTTTGVPWSLAVALSAIDPAGPVESRPGLLVAHARLTGRATVEKTR